MIVRRGGLLVLTGSLMLAACSGLLQSPSIVTVGGTEAPPPDPVPATIAPPPTAPQEPNPDPSAPTPGTASGDRGVAVVASGGAGLFEDRNDAPYVRAFEGLVMVVDGRDGDWLLVRTPCDTTAWARFDEVLFVPRREPGPVGAGFAFSDAVVVLDPGHGGANRGAEGPGGLREEVVNLDVARRARDLLEEPHTVDWRTGGVGAGDEVPAVGRVWLTRVEGPPGADYEAGLLFRAALAGAAGAHALISIHNNADPDGPFEGAGSETFYMIADAESRRLGGILVEELRRSFATFEADWVGDRDAGAKYRLRADGETDYYGILRLAEVPSVIAEGVFISNPDEEALLATPEFRQAYAEAVYRALVRFVTTDDPGSGYTIPYERTTPAGSGAPRPDCRVPAQP